MPAFGRKKACNYVGLWPVIKLVIFPQGFRAKLPGKAAGKGCAVHAMVQYAESMLKLDNNAVF
jgi:hypothetical protein